MKQVITIEGLKAVSINSAYYNDKRLGYKKEVRDWIIQCCHQLECEPNYSALKYLRENFDSKTQNFVVHITYQTPNYFNKQGTISHSSMDVGNINKTILDVVFTSAYYGKGSGLSENINHDDCFISELMVRKVPGDSFLFTIEVEIRDNPQK